MIDDVFNNVKDKRGSEELFKDSECVDFSVLQKDINKKKCKWNKIESVGLPKREGRYLVKRECSIGEKSIIKALFLFDEKGNGKFYTEEDNGLKEVEGFKSVVKYWRECI